MKITFSSFGFQDKSRIIDDRAVYRKEIIVKLTQTNDVNFYYIYYSLATHQTCPALFPTSPILHRLLPHTKHRTTTIYSHRSVQMVRISKHCETFNPLQLRSTFFHTVHTIVFKTNTPMATPIIRCKIHDAGIISLLEQHLIIFKILLHPLKYLL